MGNFLSVKDANGNWIDIPAFVGENGVDGVRGTGIYRVTTAPSSYTTEQGGFTPTYRMSLSTALSQSGATEILVGDNIRYSYYLYPVGYVSGSYVYMGSRTNIRGAAGADGADGVSVTHEWNGTTLTVTSASGTSSVDLKGDTGSPGKDGVDGSPGQDGSPGSPGADGKSAYAYAQDGGYTGTEAEFAEMLAAIEGTDWFGKGTSIASGADLDDITDIGKYAANTESIAKSLDNCPTKTNFVLFVFYRTTSYKTQLIMALDGTMYMRSAASNGWRAWSEISGSGGGEAIPIATIQSICT